MQSSSGLLIIFIKWPSLTICFAVCKTAIDHCKHQFLHCLVHLAAHSVQHLPKMLWVCPSEIGCLLTAAAHAVDRTLRARDALQVLEVHDNEVWHVVFSHSGHLLGSASRDGTAILWRVKPSGEAVLQHRLEGHDKPLCFLAFSPDDSMVLTCGNDPTVRPSSSVRHGSAGSATPHSSGQQCCMGIHAHPSGLQACRD